MRPVKVVEKKLRKSKKNTTYGTYMDGVVTIDPRQDEFQRLDTLLHEMIHHLEDHYDIDLGEDRVCTIAGALSHVLWAQKYRRTKVVDGEEVVI